MILVLLSGGFLIWRENFWKPAMESRVESLESRVQELEKDDKQTASANNVNVDELISLSSGEQPKVEESGVVAGTATTPVAVKTEPVGLMNINTASAKDLESLPGIGPVYAGRIVEYRNSNGGFKTIEEVKKVKGIGEKTFEKFKDKITVD